MATEPAMQRPLEVLDVIDARSRRLDRRIRRTVVQDAVAERLQTGPGIGPFGALLLLVEIGRIDRVASSHQLAAYAGLVPSTRSAGDQTMHGAVQGTGSAWLKWVLIEIVQTLKLAPGADRATISEAGAVEGQGESDLGGGPETVLLPVLDAERRLELGGVAAATRELGVRPVQALVSVA
jgi:transposase